MSTIMPYDFSGSEVRGGMSDDGQPCVVGKDVCAALGISKYRDALSQLDNDERVSIVVDTPGGPQRMTAVTESGVYGLLLIAPSGKAQVFRRWLKREVLPQIRRTGQYVPAPAAEPVALPPAESRTERVGHGLITVTREPDETWVDLTDIYFMFDFRDSVEAAAWLPPAERRQVPGKRLAPGLPLWQVSSAGLARLLAERKPAAYMPYGCTLTHTAMQQWVTAGHPALPPANRRELT